MLNVNHVTLYNGFTRHCTPRIRSRCMLIHDSQHRPECREVYVFYMYIFACAIMFASTFHYFQQMHRLLRLLSPLSLNGSIAFPSHCCTNNTLADCDAQQQQMLVVKPLGVLPLKKKQPFQKLSVL